MNSSPRFPPPFSPCRPRERAQACQKSLADVYRTGLAISHGALWYLIYIRPDMGELKGLFWDIPHRWIWFLQLEQFPKYVPPSRFWSVLTINGQSLILHKCSRYVFIPFRKHSCKIIGEHTTVKLDQPAVTERKKYCWLLSTNHDVTTVLSRCVTFDFKSWKMCTCQRTFGAKKYNI